MSTDKKPSPLPKLRTFAHDLETTRAAQHRTIPTPGVHDEKQSNKPATKLKPTPAPRSEKVNKKVPALHTSPTATTTKAIHSNGLIRKVSSVPEKETSVHTVESLQSTVAQIKTVPKIKSGTGVSSTAKEVRDSIYEATIITDAKHNRFNLGGEVIKSLSRWWQNLKKSRSDNRKQKYTVPRAERRKGVIQRATSSTARATTADHSAVIQRIKDNKNEDLRTTSVTASIVSEVTSPTVPVVPKIEPVPVPLIEYAAPIITYRNIIPTPDNSQPEIVAMEIEEPEQTEEIEEPLYEEETVEIPTASNAVVIPIIVTPIKLAPIQPNIPQNTTGVEEILALNQEKDEREKEMTTTKRKGLRFALPTITIIRRAVENPNHLALGVLSIVTVVFAVYIAVQSLFGTVTETGLVATEEAVLFTGAVRYQSAFIATNKQTMFDQISSYKNDETTLYEVVFTDPDNAEEISAAVILDILETSLPADFSAEIESIVFGYYRGEPWLALRTNNKNTAYGGMFQWEMELSRNLEPWFGSAVPRNTTGSQFKDGVIDTVDVRVLQSADGRERITYGFVGQNNILITTNTTAFLNLKTNLQE